MKHRITFADLTDVEVLVRGSLGQSTVCISESTGLSQGQIAYRLRKVGIKRTEYRNGYSEVAREVMATFGQALRKNFQHDLPPRFKDKK